jgi:hypothetical protein
MLNADLAHYALPDQSGTQRPQRPTRSREAKLARLHLRVPDNGSSYVRREDQWMRWPTSGL